ncbi:LuxR C-terminal-related transcriptional regulator [Aliidiomarina indica]|uniref:LuxR C-terminal-related transcriptional regulator n=1 Tax=Aliidiomarina indica TaxID=2749147 RepID=UPI00189095E1|nr:response regulator transcription factor [Aliidiomarina indica]
MSDIILALRSRIRQAGLLSELSKLRHNVVTASHHRNDLLNAAQPYTVPVLIFDEGNADVSLRALARSLKQQHKRFRILAWCDNLSHAMDLRLHEKAIDGFLLSHSEIDEIEKAVRTVTMGSTYVPSLLNEATKRYRKLNEIHPLFSGLSRRESQIFQLIATGLTVPEIATRLFISRKTVNTFRYRLFRKLHVEGDVQLAHLAYQHGLLTPSLLKRLAMYPQPPQPLVTERVAQLVADTTSQDYQP